MNKMGNWCTILLISQICRKTSKNYTPSKICVVFHVDNSILNVVKYFK